MAPSFERFRPGDRGARQRGDGTARSGERGMAMVVALFMVLVLSVVGSSLTFVSRTETLASLNYKTLSQVRYAGESGVHSAANYLLHTYVAPTTVAELANYDMTVSPVTYNGAEVVLSSDPDVPSNYPVQADRDAFSAASQGTLSVGTGAVVYTASARLLSMRQINDAFTGTPVTLQTWEITGTGWLPGAGSADVEMSAIIERQDTPVFKYAAFATNNGCDALRFGGGATTDSYDSSTYGGSGSPTIDSYGGNVGTNGNLTEIGSSTVIHGSLSTPRSGVGTCSDNNVTALTTSGGATIDDGLIELPQPVPFPTPPAPDPLPPTGNQSFNGGCPGGTGAFCQTVGGDPVIDPSLTGGTVTLADVKVMGGTNLVLKPGTYIVNSLSFTGNSTITVDVDPLDPSQQVIFQVAGQNSNTPIDFTGGSLTNSTYDPSRLQFQYGGDQAVKLTGGSAASALIYAPHATASFAGGSDFYGSVVAGRVTDMGGTSIHYDRQLEKKALTAGNPTMTSFTWRAY